MGPGRKHYQVGAASGATTGGDKDFTILAPQSRPEVLLRAGLPLKTDPVASQRAGRHECQISPARGP